MSLSKKPAPLGPADNAFRQALQAHRKGDVLGAEKLYRQALAGDPNHAGSLQMLGQLRAHEGHLAEATALMQKASEANPGSADLHNDLGTILKVMGRFDEAVAHFEKALALKPALHVASLGRGVSLLALGRFEDAYTQLSELSQHMPEDAGIGRQAGLAALRTGRLNEAIEILETALRREPASAEANNTLGMAYDLSGRPSESVACFQRALTANPEFADGHYNLGSALRTLGRLGEAVPHFERAAQLAPGVVDYRTNLGITLQALGQADLAIVHLRKAVALRPYSAEAQNNLGSALSVWNDLELAVKHLKEAVRLKPDYADAWSNLGNALGEWGRAEESVKAHERAIALAPRNMLFHRHMSVFRKYTPGDPHLAVMGALEREVTSLGGADQSDLEFALGKAMEDLGDFKGSFAHLLTANKAYRSLITYEEAAMLAQFQAIQSVFSRELIQRGEGGGDPSEVPVFVLGMPRSGTSLCEQVLASHPSVFGAGEQPYLAQQFGSLVGGSLAGERIPIVIPSMGPDDLRRFGEAYVKRLATHSTAARVIDKTPANFLYIGLIHLSLPNARIIHIRRNPIDTCISCFSKRFSDRQQLQSYDLAELGRYYRAYEELMQHWRSVLPPGSMLECNYEDMVGDLEGQARRLVAYCGLDWDPACLAFFENKRAVRTASSVQVRKPIYSSSVGRWKAYGEGIRPLLEALGIEADRALSG